MVNKIIKVEFRQNYKDLYFKIERVLIYSKMQRYASTCTTMHKNKFLDIGNFLKNLSLKMGGSTSNPQQYANFPHGGPLEPLVAHELILVEPSFDLSIQGQQHMQRFLLVPLFLIKSSSSKMFFFLERALTRYSLSRSRKFNEKYKLKQQ